MKKTLAVLLCALMAITSLAACGGQGTTPSSTAPSSAEQSTSLGDVGSSDVQTGDDSDADTDSGAGADSSVDSDGESSDIPSGEESDITGEESGDAPSAESSDVQDNGSSDKESTESSDKENTESSDKESTESSDDVGVGSSAESDIQSGDTDNSGDVKETVTVEFKLWAGSIVSGSATVEIEKGGELDPDQIPEVKRSGYVLIGWAYNAIGTELWAQGDIFDEDTSLLAIWKRETGTSSSATVETVDSSENDTVDSSVTDDTTDSTDDTTSSTDDTTDSTDNTTSSTDDTTDSSGDDNGETADNLITELKNAMAQLGQSYEVCVENKMTVGDAQTVEKSVVKVNGQNEYLRVEANGTVEEMWYVDGVFYTALGGKGIKLSIPYEQYVKNYKAVSPASLEAVLGIPNEWIKEAMETGEGDEHCFTVLVDGEKYTEFMKNELVDIIYSDLTYTLGISSAGIGTASVEYEYIINGSSVKCCAEITVIEIGDTVVEAPENSEDYQDITSQIK